MVMIGVRKYHDQIEKLVPVLGRNVMLTLSLPLLMSVGVLIGHIL